ncbi:hypothetical protein N0V93_007135 [Gnomoniopsis smithogilvyi]|uniref:Cytochrome P450 n=1 Tax=Gnomoniopsis smithogilvyi TaxID=1191159 RepID=A0A9W8YPI6_9PEZI|nr:hypothetical protein N0V93_007135 [Gnomoniopsis smithogilvyi]
MLSSITLTPLCLRQRQQPALTEQPPCLLCRIHASENLGPFIAKFTNAYGGINAARRRLHLVTHENHLRYGSVFRQAPNRLIFNTVTSLQDIYLNPQVTKGQGYADSRLLPTPNLFDTLDQVDHGRKRRIIGKVLSEQSMRIFEPTLSIEVNIFLRELLRSSQQNETIDMSRRCQRLSADVICQLGFGYPLRTQTEDTNRPLLEAFVAITARMGLYMNWAATSVILDPLIEWLAKKASDDFTKSVEGMVKARIDLPKDARFDLYNVALSDKIGSEEGIRDSELWAEAVFFITAGGTTTGTLMSAVFFYLSRHPEVYAKLASEIRGTFSSGREISNGPKLISCRYLRAVIDECLRISPASIGTLWRQQDLTITLHERKPFIVDGHLIPPGTQVGISPYSLLHNAAYFPEPFEFRPERWLEDGPKAELSRRAFAPFAIGDRSCGGRQLAYLETRLAVARALWYFDFEKARGEAGEVGGGKSGGDKLRSRPDEFQLQDVIVAEHDGPNLIFKPRGESWRELVEEQKED